MLSDTIGETERGSWCKLVLVCAPAGYGKTTLLADFSATGTLASCWLHLDARDKDPLRFLRLLFASIQQRFPQLDASLEAHLTNLDAYEAPLSAIMSNCYTFINILSDQLRTVIKRPIALILCNYETVNEETSITTLIEYLLEKLPQQCVLIVESRAVPKFNFSLLIARRQVIGLGIDHLRFTAQHIFELAKLLPSTSLSMEQAKEMAVAYDGWITGILLGTHLSMIPALPFHIDQVSASLESFTVETKQQNLFIYLVSEIFKGQEQMYIFLRELSILPEMHPTLCNALLSIDDAEQHLQELEQKGLFVTHSKEDDTSIYKCHHTLRELLMHDLQAREPARWKELQTRASQLYAESDAVDDAITHAIAAEAYTSATDLIIENAKPLFHQGRSDEVAAWIDALPPSLLENTAALLSIRASIHLVKYELQQATILTEKALETLSHETDDHQTSIRTIKADLSIIKGSILFRTSEYILAQQCCQHALELLPIDESEQRTQAYQILGACDCLLGHCQAGIAHLQQALHFQKRDVASRQTALLHMYLANAYNITGNYALAEHHRSRAMQNFEDLNDSWGKIDSLIGMGTTKRLRGLLSEAETIFQQALNLAQEIHSLSSQAYALLNLSEVYQDQHRYAQALVVAEDGQTCAEQIHDTYLTNCLLGSLALTYLYLKDASSALLFADKIKTTNTDLGSFENALHALIKGMILFEQQHYDDALHMLISLDTALATTELEQLHTRTLIYLSACSLAQGDTHAMETTIKRAIAIIKQHNCEHLALIEFSRLPSLTQAIGHIPAVAEIWQSLHLDEAATGDLFVEGRFINRYPPGQLDTPSIDTENADKAPQDANSRGLQEGINTRINIVAFGEPAVLIDDIPVTHWRMARSMELFFFLLNADRPVHKEQIIAAFWPEGDDHAEQNVRTTIYHLRRAIGEQCILYRSGSYVLQLSTLYQDAISYDVALFRQYAFEAQELLDIDEAGVKQCYQRMIELYKGDYVQSFYLDWSVEPRRRLRDQYLDAHQQLALIAWKLDEYEESLEHWRHILALDNCQEMAHEGMMRCYLKLGKRDLASRQYRLCARTLHDELGITPGPSLQKLYQRLKME